MNKKQTLWSSVSICTAFSLLFIIFLQSNCEKVIKSKPKSTPVFSLEKQEWLEKQVEQKIN
jgi:hypothetical protein